MVTSPSSPARPTTATRPNAWWAPDDISLVGFDDLPGSAYTTPPLTTVRQPLYEMGRIAADALIRLMNGEAVTAALPPLELVVRETTRRLG